MAPASIYIFYRKSKLKISPKFGCCVYTFVRHCMCAKYHCHFEWCWINGLSIAPYVLEARIFLRQKSKSWSKIFYTNGSFAQFSPFIFVYLHLVHCHKDDNGRTGQQGYFILHLMDVDGRMYSMDIGMNISGTHIPLIVMKIGTEKLR